MSASALLDSPPPPPPRSLFLRIGGGIVSFFIYLLLIPLGLAFFLLFMVLWLVSTLTGLGPLYHAFASCSDASLLAATTAPGGPVKLVDVPKGGKLAVRWSQGTRPNPVCLPNGLGATLITISTLHEALAALGFSVLSYDRDGVGLSPRRPGATSHVGASGTVEDMRAVMDACSPGSKWLLVGPSMGSIVMQCFIAAHPEMVVGALNMDGLPFPFARKRGRFEFAASAYRMYASITWTGVLRAGLGAAGASLAPLSSAAFPLPVIVAQMNQRNFFASLAREMYTMMDCADAATAAWGPAFDMGALPLEDIDALANAAPAECGDVPKKAGEGGTGDTWVSLPRSPAEVGGSAWTPQKEVKAGVLARMLAGHTGGGGGGLPQIWQGLVVRVMSARSYSLGALGEAFYDADMRKWAAAEHNLHALLAASGARTVFPKRHHGEMFFGMEKMISAKVVEMAGEVVERGGGSLP